MSSGQVNRYPMDSKLISEKGEAISSDETRLWVGPRVYSALAEYGVNAILLNNSRISVNSGILAKIHQKLLQVG